MNVKNWYSAKQKMAKLLIYIITFTFSLIIYFIICIIPCVKSNASTNVYSNIAELKSAEIKLGSAVTTKGFYSADDYGGAKYIISSNPIYPLDTNISIQLNNGLYANLVFNQTSMINVACFGIKTDTCISQQLNSVLRALDNKISGLKFNNGTYYIDKSVYLASMNYCGANQTTFVVTPNFSTDYFGIITTDPNEQNISISLKNINFSYTPEQESIRYGRSTCLVYFQNVSKCTIKNCNFFSSNIPNSTFTPTVLFWVKSSYLDTLTVTNSKFDNLSGNSISDMYNHYVGGCLWVSGLDKVSNNNLSKINISKCFFTTTVTDEAVAFWHGNFNDISVGNCTFDFYGNTYNDNVIAFHHGIFSNSIIKDNTFNIKGKSTRIIKYLALKGNSSGNISNNSFNIDNNNFDNKKACEIIQIIDDNITDTSINISSNKVNGAPNASYESFITLKNTSNKHIYITDNISTLPFSTTYVRTDHCMNGIIEASNNTISNTRSLTNDNESSVEYSLSNNTLSQ